LAKSLHSALLSLHSIRCTFANTMKAMCCGRCVVVVWRHFRFYPTRLEKRSNPRDRAGECVHNSFLHTPSRSRCSFIRAAPHLIQVHRQHTERERERPPIWVALKGKSFLRERGRAQKYRCRHTHFLLPHTFHWKNIYTKAKAENPLQICEKNEMETNTSTWLQICCANFWAMALCVSFRMPKRFILFSFRFHTVFFFRFLHAALLATCERKREGATGCARETERYGLFMKNTWFLCTSVFGTGQKRERGEGGGWGRRNYYWTIV